VRGYQPDRTVAEKGNLPQDKLRAPNVLAISGGRDWKRNPEDKSQNSEEEGNQLGF
jgi:hypothetical protein